MAVLFNPEPQPMTISTEDALSLLHKWQEERRLIQSSLIYSEYISANVIGRIEEIKENSVRINARSLRAKGAFEGILLDLADSTEIQFQDWRDAAQEFAQRLKDNYEAQIVVRFRNAHCELYAMKTEDELPAP
jgi:hypothetical protein